MSAYCPCPSCRRRRLHQAQALASYSQIALQATTPSPPVSTYSQMALLQEAQRAPQILPKEIVAAPVEGWRIWTIYSSIRPLLGSVGIGPHPWDPVERARCATSTHSLVAHSAPFADCGCGLWAFKDASRVEEALRRYAGNPQQNVYGYGRVQLWGKIIECEHGWRGEYARPLEVTLLGADDKTAQAIREFYGCEVTVEAGPEWLRAAQANYWQPHRAYIQPGGPPAVFPTKRRRPSFGAVACLVAAVVNTVFACLGAFFWNHSAWSWGTNAVTALAGLIVCCLSWDTP